MHPGPRAGWIAPLLRHKTTIALLIAALAVPATACGEEEPPQTAAEFCAQHGRLDTATQEADGDVSCADGAEFEADGDEEESSSSSKSKKAKKAKKKR